MKRFLCGVFDHEQTVLEAVRAAHSAQIPVFDVYTPYAVHGLDEAMGIARSRLPWVCFIAGALGGTLALWFQTWTLHSSWPINVGGKPTLSIPAFIPVTFEMTVLLGGLATVAAFFVRARLFPGQKTPNLDLRITDDRFILAVEQRDGSLDPRAVKKFLQDQGALEIIEREVEI